MNTAINILLPVKSLAHCKTRLASVLTLRQRQQLVITLLKKNLQILVTNFPQHHVLVISPDPIVASIANEFKVSVLMEPRGLGLNQAVVVGTEWSLAQGYQTQLVLAPDIAGLEGRELKFILDQLPTQTTQAVAAVIIGVANDGGTNALITQPPNAIPFRYGPRSSTHMSSESRQRGIGCRLLHLLSLALDIDTPDDWMQWQAIQQNQRKQKQGKQKQFLQGLGPIQQQTVLCEVRL